MSLDVGAVKKFNVALDGNPVGEVTEPEITFHNVTAGSHVATVQAEYASGLSEIATRNFSVDLVGDLNADGIINVSDVTALINHILGSESYSETIADINADGTINVTDVTTLTNYLLTK